MTFLYRNATRYLVLLLLAAAPGACSSPPTSPEDAIREWVTTAEEAAEQKDRGALMSMVSTSYTDSRGYERAEVERMLRVLFLRQNKIILLTDIESIAVHQGTAADVVLKVAMAGANDSTLGFSADAYRFAFELHLERGEWMLTGARWGALGSEMR